MTRRGQERSREAGKGKERPGKARRGQGRPGEPRRGAGDDQERPGEVQEKPEEARKGQGRPMRGQEWIRVFPFENKYVCLQRKSNRERTHCKK